MKGRVFVTAVGLMGCGGGPELDGRCKTAGSTACDFGGSDVLLCVDHRWSLQETCEFGTETCVLSKGVAVCSAGGEACDADGDTRCDGFTLLRCDGQAWEVYEDCFPDSCETAGGASECVPF